MKVMYFIHGLSTGGAETLVKEYALNLNKEIFEVVILCINHFDNSPYEEILRNNNIRVIYICDYLNQNNKKNTINKTINYIKRFLLIKHFIKTEKPDVLHVHLPINKYVKFAKPDKRTKMFYTIHGDVNRYKKLYKNDFKAINWIIKRYNLRIICLHEEMRDEVNNIFNIDNSLILNNGINFSGFSNKKTKKEIRDELKIERKSYVLGHVGRFSKVKNHSFLIRVFNEFHKINNNSFLLLVGDGEEKDNIIKMLHEYELDNNYLILSNRTDLPDILNAMDVFVFPSISEGLPLSLIEAQKAELTCLISERITNKAIISNLVTKLSIDNGVNDWVKALLNIKQPNEIYLEDKEWNIENVVKNLEKIYLNED